MNRWFRPWLTVGLLWLVALLNYLDRLLITSMRDPLRESIHMTDAQFGLLSSVFLWVYAVLSPFAGYLADRVSRRLVIIGSLLVWSAVTWLTGHVHTFHHLLAARALMGISEACYVPAALALIIDFHPGRTRSLATGVHMTGIYTGAALGGIGGHIAEHYGWRAGFSLFGTFGVTYAIVLAFLLSDAPRGAKAEPAPSDPPSPRPSAAQAARALFGVQAFWLLMLTNAFFGSANWSINGWLPTYLREHFHLGLGAAGMLATAPIQAASFLGVLIGGAWADRWSRANSRARLVVPAFGFLLAGPCLYLAASIPWLALAIAGLVVYGLAGRGFFDCNLMPAVRQTMDARFSATAYGCLNFISCVSGGLTIYVGGRLLDANVSLSRIFQFSAAGLVGGALLIYLIRPRSNDQAQPAACPVIQPALGETARTAPDGDQVAGNPGR